MCIVYFLSNFTCAMLVVWCALSWDGTSKLDQRKLIYVDSHIKCQFVLMWYLDDFSWKFLTTWQQHYILTTRLHCSIELFSFCMLAFVICVISVAQVDLPTFITEKVLSTAMKHLHMCLLATRNANGKKYYMCIGSYKTELFFSHDISSELILTVIGVIQPFYCKEIKRFQADSWLNAEKYVPGWDWVKYCQCALQVLPYISWCWDLKKIIIPNNKCSWNSHVLSFEACTETKES